MARNPRYLAAIAAALALAGSAQPAALAQAQNANAPASPEPAVEGSLISVQFSGGTVANYVELLRGALKPQPANIALSDAVADIPLPPVQLDSVTVGTALNAIVYIAAAPPGQQWGIMPLTKRNEPPAFAVTLVRDYSDGNRMTSIQPVEQGRVLQVFSIKELIDPSMPGALPPETVLSAVDLALRMAGQEGKQPPADVKFHTDSGLVIVDAPPQQIGAIDGLLSRIRDDVLRQRDRMERNAKEHADNEISIQAAAAKVESRSARLQFAKESLDQLLELQKAGTASSDEVRKAQMAFVDAKGDMDMAEVELRAAKARMDGQQTDAGGGQGEAEALRAQVSQLTQQVAALQAKIKELESRKK